MVCGCGFCVTWHWSLSWLLDTLRLGLVIPTLGLGFEVMGFVVEEAGFDNNPALCASHLTEEMGEIIINNNNSHDNVYGAVIITKVIAIVHPIHLMNVDWAPGGRPPSDQASRLGHWVCRKLAAIIHIHHRHCYYYSAHKLILILPSHEGWKAEST